MQGESSSAESKVTASSDPGPYKCSICSMVFNSTPERSGHQLARRDARESRGKPYAPVLAAVSIPHVPSDGEEVKGPAGAATEGTGSSDDPVKLDDDNGINPEENEPKAKPTTKTVQIKSSTGSSERRTANKRPVGEQQPGEHHDDHQPQQQQQQKELRTRDLLALWNPTRNNVEDGIGGVEDFDLNVEWQLRSDQYAEEVDLELRLGF